MSIDKVKVGIIGGSNLEDPEILDNRVEHYVDTPFGKPSDALFSGTIGGVDCILLARHGRQHAFTPTQVNYRANLYALRAAGCTHVLVTTLAGSLKEEIKPGDFVVLDQFYDKTFRRNNTIFDNSVDEFKGVYHVPMHSPYNEEMRKLIIESCKKLGYRFHPTGTVVTVEGPRFSTRAESLAHRQLGFDIVGMTASTECMIAKELALSYASIAIATDYDCWHEEVVDVDSVNKSAEESIPRALKVLRETVAAIGARDVALWRKEIEAQRDAVKKSRLDKLPDNR